MLFEINDDGSLRFDVISKKGKLLDTGVITPPVKPATAVANESTVNGQLRVVANA